MYFKILGLVKCTLFNFYMFILKNASIQKDSTYFYVVQI